MALLPARGGGGGGVPSDCAGQARLKLCRMIGLNLAQMRSRKATDPPYRVVQVKLLGSESVHKAADGLQVALGSRDMQDPPAIIVADAQGRAAHQQPLDDGHVAAGGRPHQGRPAVDVRPEDALAHHQ